jgi:hypothetical protein
MADAPAPDTDQQIAPTQQASPKKTVVVHSAATQAAASPGGGYAKQTLVILDGVVWISNRNNNTYHPGDPYWGLAY